MTSSCAVPYGLDSLNVKRGGFVLVAAADVVGLGGEVLGPATLLLDPDVPGGLHAARLSVIAECFRYKKTSLWSPIGERSQSNIRC